MPTEDTPGIVEPVSTFADTVLPSELLDDAPGDDRTDHALKARHQAFEEADALNWLLEGTPGADGKSVTPEAETERPDAPFMQTAVTGIAETFSGKQPLGGVIDAANSILEFAEWAGAQAEELAPIGGVQLFEEGKFAPRYVPPSELAAGREAGTTVTPDLPDIVGQPKTMLGAGARAITQMLRPYV